MPYANSEKALATFLQLGASQVQLVDPLPSANHSDCAPFCLLGAKSWFDSLKK
jgi:hypothetical protein